MRSFKTILWTAALLLVCFAAVLLAMSVKRAQAHMHERPDLDQWFRSLYSKERGPCCDSGEAETMADVDWRSASEMKKDECVQSDPDYRPAVYCVRLENPDIPSDYKWWIVPAAAVVELPNRAGPSLIWMVWNNRGTPQVKPFIRCFLPGTLS